MKNRMMCLLLTVLLLTTVFMTGCSTKNENNETDPGNSSELSVGGSEAGMFRPVDCGVQPQENYEYPFLGLTLKLSQTMLEKMESRDVYVSMLEDYVDAETIQYACLRFFITTEEQKQEETMSVDIYAWEEALEKLGAIGVYQKGMEEKLDELTACDTHKKIGESADGAYEYYLSINSVGNQELVAELEKAETVISEMHKLDPSLGYSAFSADRIEGVSTIGEFTTEDVFGETCTEDIFGEYDLTLVNAFATWCSPCVEEIPELEKLRQNYAEKGIKLGVVAVVLDAKTNYGIDEGAVEQAQILSERSGAQFPFLIPDEGEMNGRLHGIESVPESFFVDKNGNIVSDPYIGANTLEHWTEIVEQELEKVNG